MTMGDRTQNVFLRDGNSFYHFITTYTFLAKAKLGKDSNGCVKPVLKWQPGAEMENAFFLELIANFWHFFWANFKKITFPKMILELFWAYPG